jgi:uncharacterized protein YlaI
MNISEATAKTLLRKGRHLKSKNLGMEVHGQSQNNKCSLCDKTSTQSSSLKMHVKAIHDNIRDNKCSICDKIFSSSSSLMVHVKIVHDNIWDNKCSLCDKTFHVS